MSVLEHLQTTSQEFGQLRYLNEKLGLNVQFERLSPYRFVSEDTWMLDRPSLISEYARLSQLSASDVEAFRSVTLSGKITMGNVSAARHD